MPIPTRCWANNRIRDGSQVGASVKLRQRRAAGRRDVECRDHEFGDHGTLRRAALLLFGILSQLIENRRDLLAALADRMNCRDHRLPSHFAPNPAEILPQLCGAFPDECDTCGNAW
jgi:hypothetical protein